MKEIPYKKLHENQKGLGKLSLFNFIDFFLRFSKENFIMSGKEYLRNNK